MGKNIEIKPRFAELCLDNTEYYVEVDFVLDTPVYKELSSLVVDVFLGGNTFNLGDVKHYGPPIPECAENDVVSVHAPLLEHVIEGIRVSPAPAELGHLVKVAELGRVSQDDQVAHVVQFKYGLVEFYYTHPDCCTKW